MIGKLKGLIDGFGDDHVHIDVGGVVYEAFCSSKTLGALPQVGHAAVVHIEMIVREELIRLYGFATPEEKAWFTTLMTVQGVGARVALSILSTLTTAELQSAIALQDKAMVGRANGVGPKLALRIVTELKGKAPAISGVDGHVLGLQQALGEHGARQRRRRRVGPRLISAIRRRRRAPPSPASCSAKARAPKPRASSAWG